MKETTVVGLFKLAGIGIYNKWKIENQYWPDCEDYQGLRKKSPWWLIRTNAGLIEIGWRKRVISIDWKDTGIEHIVSGDITKNEHMCHAWSEEKALEFLKSIAPKIKTTTDSKGE